MLKYQANFQLPNSAIQCEYVYAVIYNIAEWKTEKKLHVVHYADQDCKIFISSAVFELDSTIENPYDYLLSLEEYKQYSKV